MTESETMPVEEAERPFAPKTYMRTLPGWKKLLIVFAGLMVVVGFVALFTEDPAQSGAVDGSTGEVLPSTLVPSGRPGDAPAGADQPEPAWSEAFFGLGFSFFVGFAVGYAARAFLKLVLIFVGLFAVGLFLLSYSGFVIIDWDAMDQTFSRFGEAVKGQFGAFRSFITGSLPSAGLAGLGLFAGFKKNG